MKKLIAAIALTLAVCGCSTTNSGFSKPDLNKVQLGMNREQVIKALGKPDNVATQGRAVYLEYGWDKFMDGIVGSAETFYVRLVDGRVESCGRKGDFDSTKNAILDINLNQKVDTTSRVDRESGHHDLFTELKKLQALKEEGAITQQEYDDLRKAAVERAK